MLTLPKCEFCKNYNEDKKGNATCNAFPDGIPNDKMWEPDEKECNNGIKFEEE